MSSVTIGERCGMSITVRPVLALAVTSHSPLVTSHFVTVDSPAHHALHCHAARGIRRILVEDDLAAARAGRQRRADERTRALILALHIIAARVVGQIPDEMELVRDLPAVVVLDARPIR